MKRKLYYNTVSVTLRTILQQLMDERIFSPFRLVGGTSLSLQYGHRISHDIDLFTDSEYGSLNFHSIQDWLKNNYSYCFGDCGDIVGPGTSYIIGSSPNDSIKLDLFYTDPFIENYHFVDGIRFAAVQDVIAMKIEVINSRGRKKDFWDIHELHDYFSFTEMFDLHEKRFPYSHNRKDLIAGIIKFTEADKDPDPICLLNKNWQIIKLDITEWVENELINPETGLNI